MASGCDQFHVDGQEESEAEEGDDDEVDEADCYCWCRYWRTEWAKGEERETDGWGKGLRCCLQVCNRDGGVLQDLLRPRFAEHGGDFDLETVERGEDIVVVSILVAGFDPDDLACA